MSSHATIAVRQWPPDDTEESILGSDRHQQTIMHVRWGLNEAAAAAAQPDAPLPWQAGSQTLVSGFRRPDGSAYATLPDVFVYLQPFDHERTQMALREDGPPALIVEVLSESTARSDLDLRRGKGYSYAHGGVAEYLLLDPGGEYLPGGAQGQGWRLEDGVYVPWEPDAQGRWVSSQVQAAIGFDGPWTVVYGPQGQVIPREGQVLRALAERQEQGARAVLLRLLAGRFGPLPDGLVTRLGTVRDVARLEDLVDVALRSPSLDAFTVALAEAGEQP